MIRLDILWEVLEKIMDELLTNARSLLFALPRRIEVFVEVILVLLEIVLRPVLPSSKQFSGFLVHACQLGEEDHKRILGCIVALNQGLVDFLYAIVEPCMNRLRIKLINNSITQKM